MSKADDASAAARRKANEVLGRSHQKDRERLAARDNLREADARKTARLRELRLARDAAQQAEKPRIRTPSRRGER
jgi:hypothetical protein